MRILAVVVCVISGASLAQAQTLELGGRLAAACAGSDGSGCGGGKTRLVGLHTSVWADDRFELSASVARSRRKPYEVLADNKGSVLMVSDRSREFVSLLFVYHFQKGRPVRPMLGFGSGWFGEARTVACRPATCEPLPKGYPPLGRARDWQPDIVFVVGLSTVVREHWIARGGWQTHRFMNDENSTEELFIAAGYRF